MCGYIYILHSIRGLLSSKLDHRMDGILNRAVLKTPLKSSETLRWIFFVTFFSIKTCILKNVVKRRGNCCSCFLIPASATRQQKEFAEGTGTCHHSAQSSTCRGTVWQHYKVNFSVGLECSNEITSKPSRENMQGDTSSVTPTDPFFHRPISSYR